MRKSTTFQLGSLLIFAINAILIIFGLIYVFNGTLMPYHWDFLYPITEADILLFSDKLMTLGELMIILVGFLFLSNGVSNLFIWYVGFRKGERWAWLASLSVALIVIPLMYVISIIAGFNFPFQVGFSSLILWIIAMLLSAKECLSTKK